jgi:hypothetical protein
MKPTDIKSENIGPKICFYGAHGAGKTALATQAQSFYCLDFDNGMRTALTLQDKWTKYRHQIEFDLFHDKNPKSPKAFTLGKTKVIEIVNQVRRGDFPFAGVLLDSLTGMSRALEHQIGKNSKRGWMLLSQNDYGLIANELDQVLTMLYALPIPVIVTAHVDHYEEDSTHKSRPYATGQKIPKILGMFFDEILYCDVQKAPGGGFRYIVSGQKTESITARTRSGIGASTTHATNPEKDDANNGGLRMLFNKMGYQYE